MKWIYDFIKKHEQIAESNIDDPNNLGEHRKRTMFWEGYLNAIKKLKTETDKEHKEVNKRILAKEIETLILTKEIED